LVSKTVNVCMWRDRARWLQVEQRGTTDCPICLTPVPGRGQGSASGRGGAVLLSCSHVFHPQCLDALERFSRDHGPCCPVCRARYRRRAV